MEAFQRIAGTFAGVALLLWVPLTFFVGMLLFSELKPEARKPRYWAFPFLIRREQLAPHGLLLLPFYRLLFWGWLAMCLTGMMWGLFFQ